VTQAPRPLTAAELLDAVADERPELPPAAGDASGESRRTSA
jgi:DNA recombination protein RmuC